MQAPERNPLGSRRALFLAPCAFLSVLLAAGAGCVTTPRSSRARTIDILNVHEHIAPTVNIDFGTAKLVFFGDLHRGMGEKDFFKDNHTLWIEILDYYYREGFSLVLLGDIEEGWGFQPDNIPIILQWLGGEFLQEAKFAESPQGEPYKAGSATRYFRVYGNHDDYFRGNPMRYGLTDVAQVYPAIIFADTASGKRMFVTHGCQGHGLHDAGDKVAAWGVFARYNWLLEILPKEEREGSFADKAEKIKADLDRHEQYVYDWASGKGYDFLIAGHTHRPIYDLNGVSYSYQVLKEDIRSRRVPLYTYDADNEEAATRGGILREMPVRTTKMTEMSVGVRNKMIKNLDKEALIMGSRAIIQARSKKGGPGHTEYYNPGCGYLSEIPCMELRNGRMYHRYFRLGSEGKLEWKTFDPKSRAMAPGTPGMKSE